MKQADRRRSVVAPLAAVALLALATSGGAQEPQSHAIQRTPTVAPMKVLIGVFKAWATPTPWPTVPGVEGLPLERAFLELRRRDFRPELAGDDSSTPHPPGTVARQDPPGGSPIPAGPRVVRIWRAVSAPPVTAAPPTATETPIPTETATAIPPATATRLLGREEPSPAAKEGARRTKKPSRLPPDERRPPATTEPPPLVSWIVVAGLAALAAAAWLALRRRPPGDDRRDSGFRGPQVEIVPRSHAGTQEIVSSAPLTRGLTLHPVPDPGEQTLEASGPLLAEGREP